VSDDWKAITMKCLRVLIVFAFFVGAAFAQDPTASAPPCLVGQKLEFRYDDGASFSRVIASREGDLCVVLGGYEIRGQSNDETKIYYDKDWVLVRLEVDGQTITSALPTHPLVGEKWLPFPLTVGKTWKTQYRTPSVTSGRMNLYNNWFTVQAHEELKVPAGTFKTFKIKHEQTGGTGTEAGKRGGVRYFWYAPEVGFHVKRRSDPSESVPKDYWASRDYELVSVSK
jgi:hypothetical protein